MDCIQKFSNLPEDDNRVGYLKTHDPDGECEKHSISQFSPKPVGDAEIVARHVHSKAHLSKTAPHKLDESYFHPDVFKRGASASRLQPDWKTVREAVHKEGEKNAADRREGLHGYAPNSERKYLGVIHFSAEDLRSIKIAASGYFGCVRIYDTATNAAALHADIIAYDGLDQDSGFDSPTPSEVKKFIKGQLLYMAKRNGLYCSPFLKDDAALYALEVTILQD